MKKLIFALVVISLFVSKVYSQEDKFFNEGFNFIAVGTEPFWGVKVNENEAMYFDMNDFEHHIATGIPKIMEIFDMGAFAYYGESERYSVQLKVFKEKCSDGMPDNVYSYSTNLTIFDKSNAETYEYKGCGRYTYDTRLNDKWVLEKLNGKEIKKEQYMKEKPFIKFKVDENKISGNAGCNTFLGNAEVLHKKIAFGTNIGLTKMECDNMNLEMEFMNTITGKSLDYSIDNGKLFFYKEGKAVMEFRKSD